MSNSEAVHKQKVSFQTSLRKCIPWVVSILVLFYIFHRVPIEDVLNAAMQANLWIFLPVMLFDVAVHYFGDVVIFTQLYRWFGTSLTYLGMMPVRGAAYILMLLNFFVGQGSMALLMNRWKNISILRASSVVLLSIICDYYVVLGFSLVGAFQLPGVDLACFFDGSDEGHLVRFLVISWMAFVVQFAFYRGVLPRSAGMEKIKQNELLSAFREASAAIYIKFALLKLIPSSVGIISYYYGLIAFGIHVPLLHLVAMVPLVWVIGAIPITVMGLGTVQAAMIWLVAPYAEGSATPDEVNAAVIAFSLLWTICANFSKFAIGAISLSRLPKYIYMPEDEP